MAQKKDTSRTNRVDASKRTRKPKATPNGSSPEIVATLSAEHLQAVLNSHSLVATKTLELKAAEHFRSKVNEEIQEAYDLPAQFTIDMQSGVITEGI